MKKRLVKMLAITATAAAVSVMPAAAEVNLEMHLDGTLDQGSVDQLKDILGVYAEETGVKVEVVVNGSDHESIMKTRMASNDMPDFFTTHGWSTIRYNEYTMDLSGQSWIENLDAGVKNIITDSEGKVCTMPLTHWTYGIVFDQEVMDANGIDPYSISTWDEFYAVCDQLKANGVTPFAYGVKDSSLGGFMEMMNSFYTIETAPYAANEELLDGTFDFTANTQLLEMLAEIYDRGYFNEDIFTADATVALQYLGTGDYAFKLWGSVSDIGSLERYFPDRTYGIIPIPAVVEGGKCAYTDGEGTAIAISNNTEYPEECLAVLEYLAQPENVEAYVTVCGGLPGFTNVDMEGVKSIDAYSKSMEKYGDSVTASNFFDREYLPNGMWNSMHEACVEMYNNEVGTAKDHVADAAEILQDAYETLYE